MFLKFYISNDASNEQLKKTELELSNYCGYQKTITNNYIIYESFLYDIDKPYLEEKQSNIINFNKIIKEYLGPYILKANFSILEPLSKNLQEA